MIQARAVAFLALVSLGCAAETGAEPGADGGSPTATGGARLDAGAGGSKLDAGAGGSKLDAGAGGAPATDGSTSRGGSDGGRESAPPPTCTTLVPGVWTNVSPPVDLKQSSAGVLCVGVDPTNAGTVYAGIEKFGIWKSTDCGSTWKQLGNPNDVQDYDNVEGFLDMPINIFVDPGDADHVYATQGVRGRTLGFFVSTDGGNVWTRPPGFNAVSPTNDVTTLAVDPADFAHILVGSHVGAEAIGVLESTDGGDSWTLHPPPASGWSGGSYGVSFLYHPPSATGDRNTWMVQDNGIWRTSNAGSSWTKVSDSGGVHHGTDRVYYTAAGVAYTGGSSYPLRSTDNGLTWQTLSNGVPTYTYHTIHGDGVRLYTMKSAFYGPILPFLSSPETDGLTFAPYEHAGSTQTFFQGPIQMRFDAKSRILYSAHWESQGLWALRATD